MEAHRQEWVLGVAFEQLWISPMPLLYSNSKGMIEIPVFDYKAVSLERKTRIRNLTNTEGVEIGQTQALALFLFLLLVLALVSVHHSAIFLVHPSFQMLQIYSPTLCNLPPVSGKGHMGPS